MPGLRASADARRLAEEVAFSTARLAQLAADPPGLYGEVARADDGEEATWLAFLIAYLGPLEDAADPFGAIDALRTPWHAHALPDLAAATVALGPRSAHDGARGARTMSAYRAFAQRAGSQVRAFTGDPNWTPQRRFDRVYERLALPGLGREGRFELLVALGRLGRYPLTATSLYLGGSDPVTLAAKRVLGIGDPLNLERRIAAFAAAASVPVDALDLALYNWSSPRRATMGAGTLAGDCALRDRLQRALGL